MIDSTGWDDKFAPLDTRTGPQHFADRLGEIAEANDIPLTPDELPSGEETPNDPAVLEAGQYPKETRFADGSSIVIEQTAKGLRATLDSGMGGNPEVFYGATENEVLMNVAVGKINATKKIKQLNRQVKLAPTVQQVETSQQPTGRKLTPDEEFQIKTQLASNPSLAMETWFQIKFGLSPEQAVSFMQKGQQAAEELQGEQEAKAFMASTPDYYPTDQNFETLWNWLAKYNKPFNRQTLAEAFEACSDADLMEFAPQNEPTPTPPATPVVAQVPQTPPAQSNERIASVRRAPRAGLGITRRETSTVAPVVNERPPSVDDLDNLSTEEINQLFSGVRRLKAQGVSTQR